MLVCVGECEEGSLALVPVAIGEGYKSEDFIGVLKENRNFGIRTGMFR